MQSELARHFSMIRRHKRLRLSELARMVGYRNVSKGCRRIDQFEKWNEIHETLLVKLAAALGIDHQTVARLIEEDRQQYLREWTEWANTPIHPVLVLGHIGGIGWTERLPEKMTQEAAEQYASDVATKMNRPICLVMSRRLSIHFDRQGNRTSIYEAKPGDINAPYVRFGRRKATFDLGSGKMEVLAEPQKPGPQEVVTDFGVVRLRSSFEVVEEEPGQVTFSIEGPIFEFDDNTPPPEGD